MASLKTLFLTIYSILLTQCSCSSIRNETCPTAYPVSIHNIPINYFDQLQHIKLTSSSYTIQNLQLNSLAVLLDGTLILRDIECGSINDITLKARRSFISGPISIHSLSDDCPVLKQLDTIYFSSSSGLLTEQHIMIDWLQQLPEDDVVHYIRHYGLRTHRKLVFTALSSKELIMSIFYGVKLPEGDPRGNVPFSMYLIHDPSPTYGYRITTGGPNIVNEHTYDLKMNLRSITPYIHCTDNIEETKQNMKVLGVLDHFYRQRQFESLTHVFDTLNSVSSFSYLVMRNFEGYPDQIVIDEHLDVDILCSDYFLAKRILDGIAACPSTEMYENRGSRILNYVEVNGSEVMFDLRYMGDNYYSLSLQRYMMARRVRRKNFYVPDNDTFIHTLLYHALVHKPTISPTYEQKFKQLGIWPESGRIKELQDTLVTFMNNNGFFFVKPNDPTVGFFMAMGFMS